MGLPFFLHHSYSTTSHLWQEVMKTFVILDFFSKHCEITHLAWLCTMWGKGGGGCLILIESRRLSLWNSKVVHIPSKSLIASRYVAFLVFASSCYNNWCVMEINKWGTIGIVLDWFGRFNWKILTCCYPVLPFWNPKSGKIWKFRKAPILKKFWRKIWSFIENIWPSLINFY